MASASPTRIPASVVKSRLLRPALTSHFQCWFTVPGAVSSYNLDGGETISLLCSEASLPGSSSMTNEINDDYTGITERFAYRKQYDDRADFTFYVDHEGYNIILLFEEWIRYSLGEDNTSLDPNYFYRANFPDGSTGYRTEMYINKFERDYIGGTLKYTFVKAYPISIQSMPVSYESSQLLKCTVSFTYNRYIVRRDGSGSLSPQEPPIPGVPGIPGRGGDGLYNPPGSPTGPGRGSDGLYNPPGSPTGPSYGEDTYFNIPGGRTGPLSGVNMSQIQQNYPNTPSKEKVSANRTNRISQPPLPGTPRIITQPIQAPYNKNAGTGAIFQANIDLEPEGGTSSTTSRIGSRPNTPPQTGATPQFPQ